MYFIRWVDAGLLHAGRQVGLTGGIQRDPSCSSIRGEEMAAVAFSETSPEAPGAIVDSEDSRYTASATREAGPGRRHKTSPWMPWREGRRKRGGKELADVCMSSTKTQENRSVENVSLFN